MVQSPPSHPPPSAPLPTHIPRSFAQQPVKSRRVWVRLTTGSSGSGIAPERALNLGSGIALYQVSLPAPGDVATLRKAVWTWSGPTFVGLVATDLRVSIRGHVLDDNVPLDGHGAERDAPRSMSTWQRSVQPSRCAFPLPLAVGPRPQLPSLISSRPRATLAYVSSHELPRPPRQAFTVRIPDKMRVPGQTFEGITADGQRVQGRVPAGGAPDGEGVAFLAPPASPWGSWVDGIVQHTGNMLRKSRAREGHCSVHEIKLD